eukprot:TRINITY_DN40631_c0_g1_i1.p1 TRINITY_DN40631_c0_g1~~TRINITY_DN40631_c0_g1_i1.p1  ORF type:complete len:257 (-),score=47.08 TRINITY_DN40631_c0_g1_i1:120-890(-)
MQAVPDGRGRPTRWAICAAIVSIAHGEFALPGSKMAAAFEASHASPRDVTAGSAQSPERQALLEAAAAASPPETLEDVEARWLGTALDNIGWALQESPLTLAQKAAAASADGTQKQPEHAETHSSGHQTLLISLLSTMGIPSGSAEQQSSRQKLFLFIAIGVFCVSGFAQSWLQVFPLPWSILVPFLLALTTLLVGYMVALLERHTLFGGIPAPLIIPLLLGSGLACLIQIVSLHSEMMERREKLQGTPPEAHLGY